MSTAPTPEPLPNAVFIALKERIKTAIESAESSATCDDNHARNYAYTALIEHDCYGGEEYRERERAATRRAFFHAGRANGYNAHVYGLVSLLKELEQLQTDVVAKRASTT